ncbi:MAG: hypothetical protein AAFY98_01050 [Verrucomicrobiota bacterium]
MRNHSLQSVSRFSFFSRLFLFPLFPLFPLCLLALTALTVSAKKERTLLYTDPDPASTGGIKGEISTPAKPIEQILALSMDEIGDVYRGEVSGPDNRNFQFKGLPIGKYDLMIIYSDSFYEGVRLDREESTLTKEDEEKIDASIQKSEPYFSEKFLHRLEGQTGRGNFARTVATYYRSSGSGVTALDHTEGYKVADARRTFKVVMLKDVGPGWQIVKARDLYPIWVKQGTELPRHHFSSGLSKIRVADTIKDLGQLDLTE